MLRNASNRKGGRKGAWLDWLQCWFVDVEGCDMEGYERASKSLKSGRIGVT